MNFENDLRQWMELDTKLKELNEQVKLIREKKNEYQEKILNYSNNNGLNEKIINYKDDKFKITNSRVLETITLKYLEKTLGEIIKNESQVKSIMEYIKKNREIKFVQEIKRFSKN